MGKQPLFGGAVHLLEKGGKNITAEFLNELKTNGKLETRGDEDIDEFVNLVNKLLAEQSN